MKKNHIEKKDVEPIVEKVSDQEVFKPQTKKVIKISIGKGSCAECS